MKSLTFAAALCASAMHSQSVPATPVSHAGEIVFLDNYIVTATPSARTQAELAQATTVLAGPALAIRQKGTLGETLALLPGVASTSYGPGASRPVIRGIGGERVRILENGAGSFDVAGLSPDHATSVEPLFAERIEIVRGPAALMFGSAASGGVVNVIDGRIPTERAVGATSGAIELRGASATDEVAAAVRASGGGAEFAWRAGVFSRDAGDMRAPSDGGGTIANSAVRAKGGFVGAGGFWATGRAGAAATLYATRYGVPGDEPVSIDLEQKRLDLKASTTPTGWWFDSMDVNLAFSDYTHTEFEGDEVGTVFTQDAVEARIELPHSHGETGSGSLGLQFNRTDLTAEGEEAFLPPSITENLAAFIHESREIGEFVLEAGARAERHDIRPGIVSLPGRSETTVSASVGAVWKWNETWSLAASVMHTTRPPNAAELFANGPHVATGSFEIGSPDLRPEAGDSFELTLRKRQGWFSGAATVFENRIDRFIFRALTGGTQDDLPVYEYQQSAARFRGFEIEAVVHLHEAAASGLDMKLCADTVRAERRNDPGSPRLPGIPPARVFAGLRYTREGWTAGVDAARVSAQRRVASNETATEGYSLLGADIAWRRQVGGLDWSILIRGENLLDRVARNHVSLLKDIVPLPGRNIAVSVRAEF